MIKRTLFLLLSLVLLVGATEMSAQQKVGRWTVYPSVGDSFSQIIETPERTYMLSSPSLFSLSDDDNECYSYNSSNRLSDVDPVEFIVYNKDRKYLLTAYANGNIDLLYDNGKTVNMSEIKDAGITSACGILSVAFAGDRIYIGTEFGLVVYDGERHLVVESGIYNRPVNKVFVMGDNLMIIVGGSEVYFAPLGQKIVSLDQFSAIGNIKGTSIEKLDDKTILYTIAGDSKVHKRVYDFAAKTEVGSVLATIGGAAAELGVCSSGVYSVAGGEISVFAPDGTSEKVRMPEGYASARVFFNDLASVWAVTGEGVSRFDLSSDTPLMLMQPFNPEAITTEIPMKMQWSADASRLYVSNFTYSFIYPFCDFDNYNAVSKTSMIEDGHISDVMPSEVIPDPTCHKDFTYLQRVNNTKGMVCGNVGIAVDPDDPGIYYLANWLGGLFVIKDGQCYKHINPSNSNYNTGWSDGIGFIHIDPYGNLWAKPIVDDETGGNNYFMVLPAAKRRDILNVTKDDWLAMPVSGCVTKRDLFITNCKKTPVNIFTDGGWEPTLYFQSHNNTPLDFSDDKIVAVKHGQLIDQTGKAVTPRHFGCAVEDHDGKVWIGMHIGVVVIDNPADGLKPNLTVRRPVVARNDGTGLGDYLLDTHVVYTIAVDASNRKWFGTNSGAYLVSADGTEIIAHYTTENSPLPSDEVGAIICDPNSNKVYMGTSNGLVCYDSDSSPAADDYSGVYAYPNPVRPEYTGWITVAGLMDNSLVKIADAAGNVFYQGRSEGGMVSWDGCDPAGRRVKSGVYFVFASQSNDGASKGAVAKILVIN